jgi:6-phosphogluconolactonase/Glucosamine-6-phosphate isomerase/deaminase
VNIIIKDDYDSLSKATSDLIINVVKQKPHAMICLASGDSPTGTYQYLIKAANNGEVSFKQCIFIGLDEWLNIDADKAGATKYYLQSNFLDKIDTGAVYFFDPSNPDLEEECRKMEKLISEKGPIDLLLAGIGLNGHIGLNEPGVNFNLGIHINDLADSTVTSAQKHFGRPVYLEQGITLGIHDILKARKLVLIASGEKKAAIISKALHQKISNQVPATIIQQHPNCEVILDKAAASMLNQPV